MVTGDEDHFVDVSIYITPDLRFSLVRILNKLPTYQHALVPDEPAFNLEM